MFQHAAQTIRTLVDSKSFDEASILECLVAGGAWDDARRHNTFGQGIGLCPRCGKPNVLGHGAYYCEANTDPDSNYYKTFNETSHLVKFAQRQISKGENLCLWLRGIVPLSMYPEIQRVQHNQIFYFGSLQRLVSIDQGSRYRCVCI